MAFVRSDEGVALWRRILQEGVHGVAEGLSHGECLRLMERYSTHNYHPLPVTIVRGAGARVWDADGRELFDCVGCYSALAQGHLAPVVVAAAERQLRELTLVGRAVLTRELALFSEALCTYTDMDMACAMNSGVEAVETAIKIARKWAYTVKGVPADQAEIIVAEGNFHGRTTTIVGFSTEAQYSDGFGPFSPGFKVVRFGDLAALRAAMTPNTAAVLMEPIQAEAGILVPPDGFSVGARELCDEHNALLVWDEIQTGFCRTGKRFAWQHEAAKPDLMTVGKALGGGVYPVSAAVGRRDVMAVFRPGDHGSTFGGNPLGAAIAVAAMADMEVRDLASNSARMGDRLAKGFLGLASPKVKEVRGKGLLVGLEVNEDVDSKPLTVAFLECGVLTKETRHRTFRFAPPLIVGASEIDEIVDRVGKALAK